VLQRGKNRVAVEHVKGRWPLGQIWLYPHSTCKTEKTTDKKSLDWLWVRMYFRRKNRQREGLDATAEGDTVSRCVIRWRMAEEDIKCDVVKMVNEAVVWDH
jgi:hypothetical protein